MNPEKWEDSDTMDSNSGVMVSNLPLIFAHGEPVSLNKMTQEELQVFVPFMVSCSIGEDPNLDWSQLRRPAWWPKKQPFRLPSSSKSRMVQLVVDCYTFHGCQYLLQFCATLHQMKPSGGYKFTDNRDGTTSMYNGHNGKLLVTFRNENREYDLKSQKTKSHGSTQKKRLLSNLHSNKKKKDVMVQPPPNVYLCDKCDDEFLSFREVQAHEKQCKGNSPSTPPMPSPDPEDLEEELLDPAEQVPFLSYFGLQPAEHTGVAPYTSPRKRHQSTSPIRKFYNHSYLLDISSPMGKYILSRTKYGGRLQMPENYVTRYERHIRPSEADLVNLRERSSNRWIVVYRPRKEQQWIHKYCFTSLQRREKLLTIQTGLDRRSRLLLANCQRVQLRVKLKRLAKKVVDRYTRRGGSSVQVPCIDLTGAEDNHDRSIQRPSSSSFISSLSTPFYFSPTTFLSNAASSSRYLPGEIVATDEYLNINSLIPSGTDIEANYFDNCTQNLDTEGNLIDPLEIKETSSVFNSFSGKSSLSLPKIPNNSKNCVASEAILPFLSKNTQNKISTLSNNGVTVTSVVNSGISQSDSSSLNKLNAEKSHPHQANSKNNGSTDKLKISRSNFNSASNNGSRKSLINSSFSNHSSHPSKNSPSGASKLASNLNCLANKQENISLVEVIELSSDDDDTVQEKGSHARSKNGYSHWSLDKSSSISGRDKRSLMSNGVPQDNSVLPSLPHFLSTTSDNLSFRSSLFHPSNIPTIYERKSPKILQTSLLTVDSEGIIKAPLQIDEDISFNIRLSNQVKEPLDNKYISNILSDYNNDNNNVGSSNNNNNNQIGNNLLYSLASKVNKSLHYITTFVRSKVCESNSGNTCDSGNVNNNNCTTTNNNICNANNNNINNDDYHHDKNHVDDCLKVRKPCKDLGDDQEVSSQNLNHSVTSTKRSREMMSLLNDECRELKRRGIEMLEHLNDHDSRVITRCIAEKTLNQMFSLYSSKEKYEELPSEFTELQESESGTKVLNNIFNGSDEDLKCVENDDSVIVKDNTRNIISVGMNGKFFEDNTLDFPFSSLPPTPPPQVENGFDENENYCSPLKNEIKRPKLRRELTNLARDECKELRGMGFHPADILGSSEDCPFILNSEESETKPKLSVKRRPSLLSYKNFSGVSSKENGEDSNLKQMMQGNKKVSRELSKLISDEWKELKRANAHPSQITNLLSAERNVRSNSFQSSRRNPGIMTGINSERSKPVSGRNLRGQDAITATETKFENPRLSQRKLIHTENGMCVLSYSIADRT